jgi:ATP-dependent Clp protease, protease subunit
MRMADAQIYLAGNIDQNTVPRLINATSEVVARGAKSVLLALSSPGGNVYWGVTAYNFLRGLGVEIITHNAGQVDSIAGVVFCTGDTRFAVNQARFLIHGVSWTLAASQAFSEKDLTNTTDALRRDRDTIAAILSERTKKPLEDVAEDMLQETVMTAQEGLAYGFVGEIKDQIFDPTQEIVRILP